MKKTLLLMNAIVLGTLTAFAQEEGQIRVKSGFTADIVAEAVPVEDNLVFEPITLTACILATSCSILH